MTLRNRVEKLEDVLCTNGARLYTEDQWDGIWLYLFLSERPPAEQEELEKNAAYCFGRQWWQKRKAEVRQLPDAELERRRNTALSVRSGEWWDAGFKRLFVRAIRRQFPGLLPSEIPEIPMPKQ